MFEAFEKLGEVTWVEHRGFDLLMLYIRNVFEIELPENDEYGERFRLFKESYFKTLKEIDEIGRETDDVEDQKSIEEAVKEGAKQYDDWWAVELEAEKYKETDRGKADEIYRDGLKQFPDSHQLMGNYALFLHEVRNDPAAEEYYERAIDTDPNYAIALGNYALFLKNIRKDNDAAEVYYKRAIEADPEDAVYLGNYANFLWKIREDYDAAWEYYERAIKADPDNAINLGNYAGFLLAQGKTEEGFKILAKSQESDPIDKQRLENLFYYYAHFPKEPTRTNSFKQIKELITSGVRSPHFDLSQNVARAVEDGHPEAEFLALLAKVIAKEADASELDRFEVWKNA